MPTQEQPIQFDKNKLTLALLGGSNFHAYWYQTMDAIIRQDMNIYRGPKDEKNLQSLIQNAQEHNDVNGVYVLQFVKYMWTHPNDPTTMEIIKYHKFIRPLLYGFEPRDMDKYALIVDKIDIFDEQTQAAILMNLFIKIKDQMFDTRIKMMEKLSAQIINRITDNKYISTDDKYMAIIGNACQFNHNIARVTIDGLKKELDDELQSDFPDADKITNICQKVSSIISLVESSGYNNSNYKNIVNPIDRGYINIVREEFNAEKILIGNKDYVPQINQSLEDRAATAIQRATDAEKTAQAATEKSQQLQSSHNDLLRQLNEERAKNARLTEQMNEMDSQLKSKDSFIKNLKMKIATLKTGMFGGNGKAIKDLQDFIENSPTR